MGQTLTHGVYLPDEGERNCYSGLASNWQLLDNSVGTIAEHTTALAGKAPAVHTHTVSQITDFPAYGNAAGTICEGNDSRLSDARTPVAHTHTKANVTDLLNSNFIPSANNSYDLGSSSYQWKNTYSTDVLSHVVEAGPWTTELVLRSTDQTWENGSRIFLYSNTHTGQTNGSIYIDVDHGDENHTKSGVILLPGVFYPVGGGTNGVKLGNSTFKWKTFNGVNPGALSLPSATAENIDTTNWNFSWNANTVTAPFDGYISIACFGSALQINNETKSYAMTFAPGSDGFICGLLPVNSGDSIKVLVTRTQTSIYEGYKFIKANGNVS